jgi:hypothetical protein
MTFNPPLQGRFQCGKINPLPLTGLGAHMPELEFRIWTVP